MTTYCGSARSAANVIQIGNTIQVQAEFTNAQSSYDPIDPDPVYLTVRQPYDTETTYQYTVDPGIERVSARVYTRDVHIDAAGVWFFRWWSDGTVVTSTELSLRAVSTVT